MQLRPAQAKILQYRGGLMAISAVPGSGKTFTLSLLASKLISDGHIDVGMGQEVLVVTYLNASVDTFKARIRLQLDELGLPMEGFDVRTLHSLALEIVRSANESSIKEGDGPTVADEAQTSAFITRAVEGWIVSNPTTWRTFLADETPRGKVRGQDILERTARTFIRAAKNGRHRPDEILNRISASSGGWGREEAGLGRDEEVFETQGNFSLAWMLAAIYGRYQTILARVGALDFDDLIWQAADYLESRPSLSGALQRRWPFILEDEAQDSVPLQEVLLGSLSGPDGNWVRVGDPNQAITSTFTAAHPRFFNNFIDRPNVLSHPLPNSGRSAPLIFEAANSLVDWACDSHPVPEVRRHAFRRQDILPAPAGDAQPNPSNDQAQFLIKVYGHREDGEIPAVARLAYRYAKDHPRHSLAILVPTNEVGHETAANLDAIGADYDDLLRAGGRVREIAAALHAVLSLLADPLDSQRLAPIHLVLEALQHPAVDYDVERSDHLRTLLRSVHRPEMLLFPAEHGELRASLPAQVTDEIDLRRIEGLADFLRQLFQLRDLAIDDMILALSDELFALAIGGGSARPEMDLAIAYQIANTLRQWHESQPEWRLPELAAQLREVADGRRSLPISRPMDIGYEPQLGRISLATHHGAKGMEWDAVFLVGIDGFWIPGDLEAPFKGVYDFLGGDPGAEATSQLRFLMEGDAGLFLGRNATEAAHIEIICERLRLLYVGITRAKRYLHISRSRRSRRHGQDQQTEPATVLGVLYRYAKQHTV